MRSHATRDAVQQAEAEALHWRAATVALASLACEEAERRLSLRRLSWRERRHHRAVAA